MTAEQQVKEIIILMSPEDASTQTDAVFLVTKYIQKSLADVKAKDQQIALLQAQVDARAQEKHDVINEKLAMETQLRKEKDDIVKDLAKKQTGTVQEPVQPKDKK